jgi:hypothetical protein
MPRAHRAEMGTLVHQLSVGLLFLAPLTSCRDQTTPAAELARFTSDGSLREPPNWETWVMVGASTGLSYAAPGAAPRAGAAPGLFHNVYLQPWAYREFIRTGVFPEGAMFVLSFFEASQKATPARAGFYEGDRVPGIEIHLKQKGSDKSGWAFYGFNDTASVGSKLPPSASCYSCHATEAAHDNVFTQFYPSIRERLAQASP